MTGINHALTGAIIVTATDKPLIALPIAFASHFLLDSLPRFGEDINPLSKFTKKVWVLDFVLLSSFIILLIITSNWLLLAGAVAAISPDFAWIYRFIVKEKRGKLKPPKMNKFNNFHNSIQNYETKYGILVEVFWFILASVILYSLTI